MINIRSLRSNISLLFPYHKLQKCIIIALTDTYITNDDSDIFASILDFGYNLYITPRQTSRGPSLTLHLTVIYRHTQSESILFFDEYNEYEYHDFIRNSHSSSSYLPIIIGGINYHLIILSIHMVTLNSEMSLFLYSNIYHFPPTHSSVNTIDIYIYIYIL